MMTAKWGAARQLTDEAENEMDLDLDSPGIEEVLFGAKKALHEFPEWWLDGFPSAVTVGWACKYLQSRSVPEISRRAARHSLRPDGEAHLLPGARLQARLMGLHGRALDPDQEPRYRMYTQAKKNNPIVWLGETWVNLNKPIVVVEGPFDLTSVTRVYRNVVSPLFATPSYDKIRRMSDALEWITLFDRGAGGDAGRERVTKALGPDHVIHHLHPPKGRKDPGEMTPSRVNRDPISDPRSRLKMRSLYRAINGTFSLH